VEIEPAALPPTWDELLAHRAWVQRLALSLVKDEHDAADLAQDAWLRAAGAPRRRPGPLRAWLGTMLRHLAVDRWRANERRRRHEGALDTTRTVPTPDELADRADLHRRVAEAVLDLREPYRSTVLLRYLGDTPIPEVARRQGVPVETVRTRLRRALADLRRTLGGRQTRGLESLAVAPLLSGPAHAGPHVPLALGAGGIAVGTKTIVAVGVLVLGLGAFLLHEGGTKQEDATPDETLAERPDRVERPVIDADAPSLVGRGEPVPGAGESRGSAASTDSEAPNDPQDAPTSWRAGPERVVGRIVDGEGNRVAAQVTIQALRDGVPSPLSDRVTLVATDEAGWFGYERLPPGDYVVTVHAEGFIGQAHPVRPGAEPLLVTLDPAFPIAGTVVDADSGEPAPGLMVTARSVLSGRGGQAWVALSDAEGAFAIGALPPGSYVLIVGPQGGMYAKGPWIDVEAGPVEAGTRDVRIEARRGLEIAGEIRDPHGRLVTHRVLVEALGLNSFGDRDYARRRFANSEPDGRFRIQGLPPGLYDLSFELSAPKDEEDGTVSATALRRGVKAGTDNLVVDLGFGVPIVGRVEDSEGKPISVQGALYVHPVGTLAGSQESVVVVVEPDGTFRTPGLDPATTYQILASGFPGYLQGRHEGVRPGPSEVVIRLLPAGTIRGRVLDEEGRPVPAGVPVSARAIDAEAGTVGSGWTAYTTAGGEFELGTLGPYTFRLRGGGGESAYYGEPGEALVRPGATDVKVRVRRGVELSGRLLDAQGTPVRTSYLAGAGENMGPGLPSSTQVSGDDGRFTLRGLPQGRVRLFTRIGNEYVQLGTFDAPGADVEVRLPR